MALTFHSARLWNINPALVHVIKGTEHLYPSCSPRFSQIMEAPKQFICNGGIIRGCSKLLQEHPDFPGRISSPVFFPSHYSFRWNNGTQSWVLSSCQILSLHLVSAHASYFLYIVHIADGKTPALLKLGTNVPPSTARPCAFFLCSQALSPEGNVPSVWNLPADNHIVNSGFPPTPLPQFPRFPGEPWWSVPRKLWNSSVCRTASVRPLQSLFLILCRTNPYTRKHHGPSARRGIIVQDYDFMSVCRHFSSSRACTASRSTRGYWSNTDAFQHGLFSLSYLPMRNSALCLIRQHGLLIHGPEKLHCLSTRGRWMLPGSVRVDNCCPQIHPFLVLAPSAQEYRPAAKKSFHSGPVYCPTRHWRNHLYHGSPAWGPLPGFSLMAQHHTEQPDPRRSSSPISRAMVQVCGLFQTSPPPESFLFQYFPDQYSTSILSSNSLSQD